MQLPVFLIRCVLRRRPRKTAAYKLLYLQRHSSVTERKLHDERETKRYRVMADI